VDGRTGQPVPGVSPAALQMGRHAARAIDAECRAGRAPGAAARPAFRYFDKGLLATIGRASAVAQIGGFKFAGLVAWLLWAVVHIFFLISYRSRLMVMIQWGWEYAVFQRGARIITGSTDLELSPRPSGNVDQNSRGPQR